MSFNDRVDLFPLAAPDRLVKAAKPEIDMTELKRFQPRLVQLRAVPFDFERASVRLLTQLQQPRRRRVTQTDLSSEWRDPPHLTVWSTPHPLAA